MMKIIRWVTIIVISVFLLVFVVVFLYNNKLLGFDKFFNGILKIEQTEGPQKVRGFNLENSIDSVYTIFEINTVSMEGIVSETISSQKKIYGFKVPFGKAGAAIELPYTVKFGYENNGQWDQSWILRNKEAVYDVNTNTAYVRLRYEEPVITNINYDFEGGGNFTTQENLFNWGDSLDNKLMLAVNRKVKEVCWERYYKEGFREKNIKQIARGLNALGLVSVICDVVVPPDPRIDGDEGVVYRVLLGNEDSLFIPKERVNDKVTILR